MKKIFTFCVSLLAALSVFAYDFQSGDLFYNITSSSAPYTVEVTQQSQYYNSNYSGVDTIVIPETVTYDSIIYSVTSIGESAFNYSKLTTITIPNTVTSIGEMAFASCDKLTSMVVESGNIIYDSRENCDAIIETATNTLIAGFQNTIIPNSVTSIGDDAFYNCTSLTSITIPNSVTSIGDDAFYNCTSLTSITIPNSVTSIGDEAFRFCSSLTSITIPNSLTSIGGRAFEGCSSLDTIHLEATTPPALGYSKVFTSSPICVIPCGTLAEYEISEWKNYVEAFVFDDTCDSKWCGDELYWKYGDGVLTIIGIGDMYDYASDTDVPWYDVHDKITSINISNGVSKIGNNAFTACISLNEIYVGATMPPILGDNALPSSSICLTPCGTLAVYEASDWANQVGSFEEFCPAVVKAKVPASWEDDDITVWVWTDGAGTEYPTTKDGDWYVYTHSVAEEFNIIFKSGTGWKGDTYQTVDINGIKKNTCLQIQSTFGKATYSIVDCEMKVDTTEYFITYTSTDGNIVTPNKTDVFGTNIISNTYVNGVGRLYFDGIVTSIGDSAFYNCETLSSITLPETVTLLGYGSFDDCTSLTKIRVKATTPPKMLGGYTFHNAPLDTCLIPCGTLDAYQSSDWASQVGEFVEVCPTVVKAKVPASWENDDITVWVWTDGAGTEYPTTKEGDWYVYTHTDTEEFNIIFKSGKGWKDERTKTVDIKGITENTCLEIQPTTGKATYTIVDCPSIIYELNGGVTNDYGWQSKADMWEDFCVDAGISVGTLEEVKASGDPYTKICTPLGTSQCQAILDNPKWDWLEAYIMQVQNADLTTPATQLTEGVSSAGWRYALAAFFVEGQRTAWPKSADFSQAGKYEAYIPTWRHAFANPTNPMGDFILNAPYKEGYTFAGWYTNADFSGEKVTTINAETEGTLYAKWIDETWVIKYTSTDGNIVTPYKTNVFGANIVSNTYENGVGTITFDGPVTSIGDKAFAYSCDSLVSITLPNSVISVGTHAFISCTKLTTIILSDNLTSIGEWAFCHCPLRTIILPNTLESIGSNAFRYTNLQSIIIPKNVVDIDNSLFFGCTSLKSIIVDGENPIYDSREDCNAIIETATNTLIAGCRNSMIPNSVVSIGDAAFVYCHSLTSITIPNSVVHIGDGAFCNCGISSITIPSSVNEIEGNAFVYCDYLSSITVDVNNTTYDSRNNCNAIMETETNTLVTGCKNTIIPNDTKIIGEMAFQTGGIQIDTLVIPDGVTSIETQAFYKCKKLEYVRIPNTVTYIGYAAFSGCDTLSVVQIDAILPPLLGEGGWGTHVFETYPNCVIPCGTLAAYEASDWASQVGSFVEECVEGQQITYTSTNDSIVTPYDVNAFDANIVSNVYENGVGTITFDGPLTRIGTQAFHDCFALTSIIVPNSVKIIGNAAFSGTYLESVVIGSGVTSIGEDVFGGCGLLTSIVVDTNNTTFDSREDCNAIIKTSNNILVAGCKTTIIPNTIKGIGNYAFAGSWEMTSIEIPDGVETIGSSAFGGCTVLRSVMLPNSLVTIGDDAFSTCPALTSITIPSSVKRIGADAFWCDYALDTLYVEATTPPTLGYKPFYNAPVSHCFIPCGTLSAYEASAWASQVGEFVEDGCAPIQMCGDDLYWEYADGVLTITGTGDMYDYAADTDVPWYDVRGNIKTVSLPDAMTKIGQNAFYKCTAMTTINMPTSLIAIGEKAFAQDTKLACDIILPASMTTIASRAFFNCQAVTAFHIEATTPPTIPNDAFERTTAPIHVPCGYGHVYGKHTQWGMLNLEMCELLQDNVYYYPIDGHTARAVTYHSNPTDTLVIPSAVVIDGMPRTVTEVADFAFTDCANLPAIFFNEGLEYIGERAFVRCYGLKGTITLPTTLTTIGERAFSYCDNVEKYLLQAMTPPTLGADVFTGNNKNALFYISCEAMDDYKVATNWSSLKSRLRDACLNIYHYNTPFPLGTNGVYTTEDTLVASIYYRRRFTPYRWETLYLPFEVDRVTVLEDGVEYDLTAWDIVNGGHYFLAKPDGMLNKEILFGFTDELESHTPYIIQFSDAYYTDKLITFYGKESWNKLSTSFEVLSSSSWMQIAGNTTMQDQLLEKPVYMLRSGLDFILQKTTTTLHPFECYVMPYTAQSGAPARMSVRLRDDVATAVESMKGNESRLAYTINGNTLTVYPQGQAFSIYSLNGALIYSCEAGKEAVDCELNSGCYLLHAGTEAHKIML